MSESSSRVRRPGPFCEGHELASNCWLSLDESIWLDIPENKKGGGPPMDRNPFDKLSLLENVPLSQMLPESLAVYPATGRGTAFAHHGELLQGVLEGVDGHTHRFLISLPCKIFESQALFLPDHTGKVRVEPAWKVKALRGAELTLHYTNKMGWGGSLQIASNVPVGWGLGSSTSDVTAAIRAVANAFGKQIQSSEVAHLAVRAETASDSTMFDERTILFAHREGMIIEDFGRTLPGFEVLGFNTDVTGIGIDTLSFPPVRYCRSEVKMFLSLINLFRLAVHRQDLRAIGLVASASANINQRYLPKPHFDRLEMIVKMVGAVGFQVAHSGTVAGIIFDARDPEKESRIAQAEALIAETGISKTWRFDNAASNCHGRVGR
jgi:uncharacterized protein involved in propanediol utilization